MKTLEEINTHWKEHCTCDLKATATQAVPGDGNPHAEVVFIGEAPGKNEDIEGRPFIGAAGKFLAEMLESIKMKREDIYITNVVKYRPPNNRDPLPEEKEACKSWLDEELHAIKPKLIVFLGRHAMGNFFPTEKISAVHGKLLKKKIPGFPTEYFLPLYHPAAALYNGGLREELMSDFQKIPLALTKISSAS
ncbi:MAG TPA: uracil-DNA glycosylase [Candidatus Paceibacterota bacterium]|jgi:DNA polymerase|nr:uracil-DNA glycosylase [Candidatus Paceibacterota bacterium]